MFRETNPEEVKLEGYIIKLERSKPDGTGIVTVSGIIEGRKKYKVKIELSDSDYETAVLAHKTWNEISCLGELIKEGK